MELEGKVALVTGGAVRIGRALSLALAKAGASVVVHYSHSAIPAQQTVDEIVSHGGRAAAIPADLQDPAHSAQAMFKAAIDRFGSVDILVNSAAIFEPGTLASTSESDWDRHFTLNLKAPFLLSREFADQRRSERPGNIVNLTDWRALRPAVGHLAYTLTKSALVTLTQLLALELAPGIRVNAVAPGAILPPAGAESNHMQRLANRIPLQRTGSPGDVASAVLYLLRSDFITGDVLCVTGGEHLL